jgi:predicted porin
MKKTLIAIAALAATSAFAQSSVTVYGVLDAGYSANSKTVNNVSFHQNAVSFNNNSSSRIGFKGTEDLGGGTTANFVIESGISSNTTTGTSAFLPGVANAPGSALSAATAAPTTTGAPTSTAGTTLDASTLGNRELNASLVFNGGKTMVGAGYGGTAIRSTVLAYDAAGGINAVGNILVNDAQFSSNRSTGLFASQVVATGLKVGAGFSRNNTGKDGAAENKTSSGYAVSTNYDNGPLSIGAAYQNADTVVAADGVTTPTANKTQKTSIVGASYALPMAKLFAQYGKVVTAEVGSTAAIAQGEGSRSGYSIGVQVPYGAFTPFVQYSSGNKNEAFFNANAGEKRKYTGHSVGVNYALSKRTYAYLVNGTTNLRAGDAPATGGYSVFNAETSVGVVHSF